jgi:hypothetical protein
LLQELRLAKITSPEQATLFVNGPFKTDFNRRFAKPARESQNAWRVSKEFDVDRICSFRYEATVGDDNTVRSKTAKSPIPKTHRKNDRRISLITHVPVMASTWNTLKATLMQSEKSTGDLTYYRSEQLRCSIG